MEALVRVKSQGALQSRNWQNNNGESIVINSVELIMDTGLDVFACEATDNLALNLSQNPLDKNHYYYGSFLMNVRQWTSQKGVNMTTTIIKLKSIRPI